MSASVDLVTATEVKDFLGISGTAHDTLIAELIDNVSEYIEDYCGMWFGSSISTTDKIDGGGVYLFTSRRPIQTITSITDTEDSSTVTSTDYTFYSTAGHIYKKTSTWTTGGQSSQVWGAGNQRYTVVYTAGFTAVPEGVKLAAYLMIERLLKAIPTTNNKGRRTTHNMVDDVSDSASSMRFVGLSPIEKHLLSKYRTPRI